MVDLKKPKRTLMELILEKKKQQYKLKMYKNNLDGCEQEGVDEIGWLGIKRYKDLY